jgi:hypothetical protein
LAVFLPPLHGKSELVSKFFPAWFLGMHPDSRVILASYGADFASSWGRKARDLLVEHGDIFGVNMDMNSSAKNSWDISGHRGGMNTGGVGSGLTGMGASLLIIDDPVKDAEHANSGRYREAAKDWYRSVAHTRLAPDGRVVLIQTKGHEDDLGSWIVRESEEDWTIVNLPALAEENDLLGRKPGEALWPERFSRDWLDRKRLEIGEYWFAALYQLRLIQGQYDRWKPVLVGIESTAYQAALSQQLLTERAYPNRLNPPLIRLLVL